MLKEKARVKNFKLEDLQRNNGENIQCVRFNEKETEDNTKV